MQELYFLLFFFFFLEAFFAADHRWVTEIGKPNSTSLIFFFAFPSQFRYHESGSLEIMRTDPLSTPCCAP